MSESDFEPLSHKAHETWYDKRYPDETSKAKVLADWKGESKRTINTWLHERMWNLTDALAVPGSSWLTVGDGYGRDAYYLLKRQCTATASDISATFLPLAKAEGLITDYAVENVEHLTYVDNSFDYVLCKESYHHFPRPYLGVYEMLRVCRKGVVLIEPHDPISRMPLLLALRNTLDRINPSLLQRIWKNRYSFEEVGNYVFKLSEREIEKLSMGINLPAVAFKGINNNYYHPSTAPTPAETTSGAFRRIRSKLLRDNLLSRAGLVPYQLLCAIIFKTPPSKESICRLKDNGFTYHALPKNPYLKTE